MSGSKETSKHKNPWIYVIKDADGNLQPYANYDREKFAEMPFNKVMRMNVAQQRSQPRLGCTARCCARSSRTLTSSSTRTACTSLS